MQMGASEPKEGRRPCFLVREAAGGGGGRGILAKESVLDDWNFRQYQVQSPYLPPVESTKNWTHGESLMDCSDRLAEMSSKCVQGLWRAPDLRRQGVDFLFSIRNLKNAPCFSNDHMQCPKALGDVQPNGASEIWPWLSRVNGHGLDSHASGWEGAAELVKQGWDETALSRGEVKRRRKWHCGNRRTRIAEVESARKSSQQLCAVGVPQRWLTVHALPSASFCSHMPASLSLLCGGFLCLTVSPSLKQNQVALIGASPHLGWYIIMLLKW